MIAKNKLFPSINNKERGTKFFLSSSFSLFFQNWLGYFPLEEFLPVEIRDKIGIEIFPDILKNCGHCDILGKNKVLFLSRRSVLWQSRFIFVLMMMYIRS